MTWPSACPKLMMVVFVSAEAMTVLSGIYYPLDLASRPQGKQST